MLILIMFMNFFFFMFHEPILINMLLIFQSIMISLMFYKICYLNWYLYILMLTFLGGILMLFLYMTTLCNNQIIFNNLNMKKWVIFLIMYLIIYMYEYMYMYSNFNINTMNSIMFIFNYEMKNMMLLMFIYLLIILFVFKNMLNLSSNTLRALN
uniref:NADH dehydrogenase subunit 6 n=1 Tax=Bathynella cf. rufa JHS-2017 TaxID=2029186 RepID=A0A7R6D8L6_9CRUS|nr:NADH dehydrogenase subunit 6 [Bathynella cf. rufa JHS-2017]